MKICIIIGDPVAHSLSPHMHNAAYEALGIDDQYVFIATQVKRRDLATAIAGIRAMGIHGITCTMPHKTDVMNYLDAIDTAAEKIGAVNTIVNENGILKGYNTDWLGIVTPLKKITSLKGKKIAVIGAGGAARSAIYGLKQLKADVYVFNRSFERSQQLAREFEITPKPMSEIKYIKNCDIIINTTLLGMHPHEHISPVPKEYLTSTHIVFDVVYSPYETQLLKDAKTAGARIIHGIEMLLHQGTTQFKLYTGKKAPEETMYKILNPKIAVSIPVTGNMQTLKKQIDSAFNQGAYAVELRLDYWKKKKLTQKDIEKIRSYTDKPVIFTFRSPKEGGRMNIDDKTRLRYIRHAIQLHFRYVDIELETMRTNNIQIQTLKHNSSSTIIISYHSFSAIKDIEALHTIRDEMIARRADICKIAVASDGETTNNAILLLIEETKRMNIPIIAIAMGEKGKTVRIEGARSGNYMTYAALDKDSKTAEGQLTIHELTG